MTVYVVMIPRKDEEGEYLEANYFKMLYDATLFATENGITNITTIQCDSNLANEIAK